MRLYAHCINNRPHPAADRDHSAPAAWPVHRTPWDVYLFEAFCEAVAAFRENRDLLRQNGYTARGSHGGVIKSPHHQIMRDCQQTMAQIGSRFGFTPGDRANLEIKQPETGHASGAERLLS